MGTKSDGFAHSKKTGSLTRALTLVVSGVLLIAAGILAGAALSRERAPADSPEPTPAAAAAAEPVFIPLATQAPTPAPTPEASPASQQELTVAPTCQMAWTTAFTLCGHTREEARPERAFIGMTEQEVRDAAKDWTLDSFSRIELRFSRAAELYCPEHVLLKSVPEGLGVYKTDGATLELQEIMKFPLDTAHFDKETQLQLELGMPFADLAEIEGYIENLES